VPQRWTGIYRRCTSARGDDHLDDEFLDGVALFSVRLPLHEDALLVVLAADKAAGRVERLRSEVVR
jgi:hypothetical protein